MKLTRQVAATAVLALALGGLAGCANSSEGQSDNESGSAEAIRVAAVLDITGPGASLGGPERQALEMLVEDLNAAGGIDGRQVDLSIEDNQSREDVAARVLSSMISEDEPHLILGASRTGPSLAMRPIAEEAQIPMISLAANAAIIKDSDWVFKTAQDDRIVLERMISHAASQGWETIGLVKDSSAYGEGIGETLNELGAEHGIEVISEESFDPSATEFTAQMISTKNAGADVNVIWGIEPAAALALRAYRQAAIDMPVMMGHGVASQEFVETAGDAANGIIVTQGPLLLVAELDDDNPQKQVITEFVENYRERFGEDPSPFAAYAFDAFLIMVDALTTASEAGDLSGESVRDAILAVEGLNGATGVFNMTPDNHSGLDSSSVLVGAVENGNWVLVSD